MAEQKVLNKYYPPDMVPSKIPRPSWPEQIETRMMVPMSTRCDTCGNYIGRGTKLNMRREVTAGETYLGIPLIRFYFRCTGCAAELCVKTNPRNSDYVVGSGARRNREPWRKEDERSAMAKRRRKDEEMGDAMKSLENRASDLKRETDVLADLDELKSLKSRHAAVSVDAMLEALAKEDDRDEDEAVLKSIVFHNSSRYIRRADDEDDDDDDDDLSYRPGGAGLNRQKVSDELPIKPAGSLTAANSRDRSSSRGTLNKFVLKSSTVTLSVIKKPPKTEEAKQEDGAKSSVLQPLCQNYSDSEDD